jgi:hypothetical protein
VRTAEERHEIAARLQSNAERVFGMLTNSELSIEQSRVALELLQLSLDLLEFEESVGRKLEASTPASRAS